MPGDRRGKAYKLPKPFRGLYWILSLFNNGAKVQLIHKPQSRYPIEIPGSDSDSSELSGNLTTHPPLLDASSTDSVCSLPVVDQIPGCWSGHLQQLK